MKRRTLLGWFATAAGTLPFPFLRIWAQTAGFPGQHAGTLRQLAKLVLPTELGREGTDRIAEKFEHWVRDYRPGAEVEHGYGHTRLRAKPRSPAAAYLVQLESLSDALSNSDPAVRHNAIETALDAASIKDLPASPDGRHIVTDLMSFYFQSSDANDLCYKAEIHRDGCRGLEGSDSPPRRFKGSA
jgi:hypothetical protein